MCRLKLIRPWVPKLQKEDGTIFSPAPLFTARAKATHLEVVDPSTTATTQEVPGGLVGKITCMLGYWGCPRKNGGDCLRASNPLGSTRKDWGRKGKGHAVE